MRTKLVPFTEWRGTLDDLSRSFSGALVSLEVVGGEVGAEEEVCNQPLRGITSDRSGVTVQIEKLGGLHLNRRIAHPKTLRIVESSEGALIAVEIEDSGGVQNLVRFLSPARPEARSRRPPAAV
ncbi:MAG TPA: DUF5335 family protein [Thermoanaerobaculia bacterium]|jgi:hypothetical protein